MLNYRFDYSSNLTQLQQVEILQSYKVQKFSKNRLKKRSKL